MHLPGSFLLPAAALAPAGAADLGLLDGGRIAGLLYAAFAVAGLLLDAFLVWRLLRRPVAWAARIARVAGRAWSGTDVSLLAAVLVGLWSAVQLLQAAAANLAPGTALARPEPWLLVQSVTFHWTALGLVAWFLRRRRQTARAAFGVRLAALPGAAGRAVAFYAGVLPILLFYAVLYQAGLWLGGRHPDIQPIVFVLTDRHPLWLRAYLLGLAVVVAPVAEELLFRGIALPALARRWGAGAAVAVTSLLFAAVHFHVAAFVPLFLIAVAFALAYLYTGSLAVPVVMHALFNAVNLALMLALERNLRMSLKTIEWVPRGSRGRVPGRVRLIDQTRLPGKLVYLETDDLETLWTAIKTLQVRGAPAIGIAAAMGMAAAAQHVRARTGAAVAAAAERAADRLATARPTAVNLFWALARMKKTARRLAGRPAAEVKEALAREACRIRDEDAAMCRAIGAHGARLLRKAEAVLTHCNAGGLATAEFGTALAPLYVLKERGRAPRVFVDETRPLLQGARLTAWELMQAGIEATLICDNMAAHVMQQGWIDAVLVGADRIAANGDTANKIGTYGVALLARAHRIPFYVLAPTSTFDLALSTGAGIPIEQRHADEVTCGFGRRTAPRGVRVYSPAFDVTPARLITAIVCEKGIARPPFARSLRRLARG